jgi:hypothetical protein
MVWLWLSPLNVKLEPSCLIVPRGEDPLQELGQTRGLLNEWLCQ